MKSALTASILCILISTAFSCTGEPHAIQFYEMACCRSIDAAQYDAAYSQIAAGAKKADDFFKGINTGTTVGMGVVFSAHFENPLGAGKVLIRIRDRASGRIISAAEYHIEPGQKSLQSYYNFDHHGRYTVQFLAGGSVIAEGDIAVLK